MQIRFSHHTIASIAPKKDNTFLPFYCTLSVCNTHTAQKAYTHQIFGVEILRFQFDLHQCWIEYDADFLYISQQFAVSVCCQHRGLHFSCNFHCDQVLQLFSYFITISRSVANFVFPFSKLELVYLFSERVWVSFLFMTYHWCIDGEAWWRFADDTVWLALHIISTQQ